MRVFQVKSITRKTGFVFYPQKTVIYNKYLIMNNKLLYFKLLLFLLLKIHKKMKTTVLTVNVFLLIILIPSIFGAVMSPMMFDAPGSEKSQKTWTLFSCMIALPVLIIIAQIISWIAYSNQNYDLAFKINALPVFDILLIIFMFFIIDQFTD